MSLFYIINLVFTVIPLTLHSHRKPVPRLTTQKHRTGSRVFLQIPPFLRLSLHKTHLLRRQICFYLDLAGKSSVGVESVEAFPLYRTNANTFPFPSDLRRSRSGCCNTGYDVPGCFGEVYTAARSRLEGFWHLLCYLGRKRKKLLAAFELFQLSIT